MWGRYILFLHNQRRLFWTPNHRLQFPQHHRYHQVMLSQTINQGRIWSNNTSAICSMAVYTYTKISHLKESYQELSKYHRQHQKSRNHIWPPDTQHTSQGNNKDTRKPQYHPKDTLPPSYGQKPPQFGAIHRFFFMNGIPFLHIKSRQIDQRSVKVDWNNWRPSINLEV